MDKRRGGIAQSALVVAFLLSAFGVLGCSKAPDDATQNSQVAPGEQSMVHFEGVHTDYREKGRRLIRILAPVQIEMANADTRFPNGIEIDHMDSTGTTAKARMTANKGLFMAEQELYRADNNVVLYHVATQETLFTEQLYWNPRARLIYTDSFLRIHHPNEVHTGYGLVASEDFETYELKRPMGRIKR